jgi:hypothetical protein
VEREPRGPEYPRDEIPEEIVERMARVIAEGQRCRADSMPCDTSDIGSSDCWCFFEAQRILAAAMAPPSDPEAPRLALVKQVGPDDEHGRMHSAPAVLVEGEWQPTYRRLL